MKKQFLDSGKIVGTHGIKGEVRIDPWCDSPEFLCAFKKLWLDENGTEFIEVKSRPHKNIALAKIKGVDTIEAAEKYRGKVVYINRVSKTVKGGRVMKFSALVVVGDGKGTIGYGMGKAAEVPEAIRKGIENAKKNMVNVSLRGTTIPHEITGVFGAGRVLMRPAAPGTGVLAGGPVRAVLEAAGIKDIRAKSLRSNNPCNVVAATFEGLQALRTADQVASVRGKSVKEILG